MNSFTPNITQLGQMKDRTEHEIKREDMVWSADMDFAYNNGGKITREFLTYLDPDKDWIIDTRVHMLMKGWYPCIGGWHLDNMPRNIDSGQPNYKNPPFICNHVLAIVDAGTGSLTEFLTSEIELPDVPEDKILYGEWSKEINNQLAQGKAESKMVANGRIITFDSLSFHRGTPASSSGFRMFLRAMTDTPQKALNEKRRQSNVYIEAEAGW